MVLSVERFGLSIKFSSKLENHRHSPEALLASLLDFQTDVSDCLKQLAASSSPLSLRWIQQCFEAIPFTSRAFAKLVAEIDYPMNKWKGDSVEAYLEYSLKLLELLNSIHSSVSHLAETRLSLKHALSLVESSPSAAADRLRKFQARAQIKNLNVGRIGESKERIFPRKERIIRQALMEMKSITSWVCGVLLSALCSDAEPYVEMRERNYSLFSGFASLKHLDMSVFKEMTEKGGLVKEVREMNEAVNFLVEAISSGKGDEGAKGLLQGRVEILEKVIHGIEKEADQLFSEGLAGRNKLLAGFRHQTQ